MGRNRFFPRRKEISPLHQCAIIEREYKSLVVSRNNNANCCYIVLVIQPTEIMRKYQVRISFQRGKTPKINVIKPNIAEENKIKPPHTFNHKEGEICLFLPEEFSIYYSNSADIVPWISEWLFFYEIWKTTGVWKGRGHEFPNEE